MTGTHRHETHFEGVVGKGKVEDWTWVRISVVARGWVMSMMMMTTTTPFKSHHPLIASDLASTLGYKDIVFIYRTYVEVKY